MGVNTEVGGKIKAEKFEPETIIEMKNYDIKADHMKNINSFEIKTPSIDSNNNFLSS